MQDLNELKKLAENNISLFKNENKDSYDFIDSTLLYYWEYLLSVGQISVDDFPEFTINLFIGSNFSLLLQVFDMVMSGNFRSAIILLRPTYEAIALCMYFCEFPEEENAYRLSKNKVKWLKRQNNIRGMVEKIENQGKIFNKSLRKGVLLNLIANPLKEINSFVHFNHEYILKSLCADNNNLILGPRKLCEGEKNGIIICLLESALFSLMVMEISIKPHSKYFIELAKRITSHIDKLKKRNNALSKGASEC